MIMLADNGMASQGETVCINRWLLTQSINLPQRYGPVYHVTLEN